MTALSEALLTAQRGALAAMQKAYVRGAMNSEGLEARMEEIGCTDSTDGALFIAALDVLRDLGAEPVNGAQAPKADEPKPATDSQWKLIRKLADERGQVAPDGPLTKSQASDAITALQKASR